ncbi:hypothetical protein LWI29_011094 [Acer saccharum]|uniref:Uncharacterized protein n=1 Tax=Acer saccharum TaxID=4024 RepID=A0AA39SSL4_ACESA|nr:hypothetical protein LWI29_011094 [Acer saccharum]
MGLWYYQGIDEVGNLYPDEALMATMLGMGDLSPSVKHDAELREADTVVLDQLERQLAKVISAADTLREEVRKSDLERKESDKGIVIQRDSAADPVTLPYPEDVAALPCVHHEIPPPQ